MRNEERLREDYTLQVESHSITLSRSRFVKSKDLLLSLSVLDKSQSPNRSVLEINIPFFTGGAAKQYSLLAIYIGLL